LEILSKSKEEIVSLLNSDIEDGLTSEKAEELLLKNGENKLKEKKKKSMAARFFEQFKDVMIIILLIAAAVSFGIACYEGEPKEFFEPALIILIIVLNALMGVMQESKAEKALDALKNMNGNFLRIHSRNITIKRNN
jgi:Ca2+-transporting ATPase